MTPPEGMGFIQGINLAVHLEDPPIPRTRLLVSPEVISSESSSGSHNSAIAKNLLRKSKSIGFSFKLDDAQEEYRFVVLEDKDCETKSGRELRSGVK
ncbi:hypothetical protein A2U01_0055127 [Trifolium medium]|uniref:Uncharacterized protein n=1 Tax=Trifolium medium TaxID=97028 RepID=A0A392RCC5_9FABA|nr:hypothetical protein [Trifolium medium]